MFNAISGRSAELAAQSLRKYVRSRLDAVEAELLREEALREQSFPAAVIR